MERRNRWITTALVAAMLPATAASGQSPDAIEIRGTVRALTGRPLVAVSVRGGPSPSTVVLTDSGGSFRIRLERGAIETSAAPRLLWLRAETIGYVPDSVSVRVVPGRTIYSVAITLTPLAQLAVQQVVAQRDRPLLNTRDATTGGAVERAELEALPTDARDPVALAYNIPGVAQARAFFGDAPKLSINGTNALYTQYTIDGLENNEGFLGGPRVEFPLAAMHRLEVMANTYTASAGRSPSGVVNYESRAGGDTWTGEAFAYQRPGLPLDARPSIQPVNADARADFRKAQEGFRRSQFGGAFGGPLAERRTYVFGALEYTTENEDRISSTARATFVGREIRETYKGFARVDHGWNDRQTTTLRFALSHQARAGEGSGIVAPEADITTIRFGSLTSLSHRSALADGRASNTISAQLGTYSWTFHQPSVICVPCR